MTKVSIVEDNDQLRATLARLINRAEGFQCLSQHPDAETALALPGAPADVVLVNINLPGMNGVEFVRRLKQAAPQILAVMLTAYEDTENIFNALAAVYVADTYNNTIRKGFPASSVTGANVTAAEPERRPVWFWHHRSSRLGGEHRVFG